MPTPVFNTPYFSEIFGGPDGRTLRTGKCRQIWELEFVALPGTVFRIEDIIRTGKIILYRVTTKEYPSKKGLFIDSRFIKRSEDKPPERQKKLPEKSAILERLMSARGSLYVWGGNIVNGIPEMLSLYTPSSETKAGSSTMDRWMLKGTDCSGLLYEATDGYTPRNTDDLTGYGKAVMIDGLNAGQIIEKVQPLDLIAWQGHVIIILDRERTIESRLNYGRKKDMCEGGVKIRPLTEVLQEIMVDRTPADNYTDSYRGKRKKFVIRRWYEDN